MNACHFTLAEDDADALFLLQHKLMEWFPGSSFASFTNAKDALDHLLAHRTDMLITNHGMGLMNGADLIHHLRERGYQFPIIMISGRPDAEAKARAAGATAFVSKTATMDGLENTVRNLLPGQPHCHV